MAIFLWIGDLALMLERDKGLRPPMRPMKILWFGNTSGLARLNQINVRVTNGIVPGTAVCVRFSDIGRPSNEVTVGVR
jgi:hypothetical protein